MHPSAVTTAPPSPVSSASSTLAWYYKVAILLIVALASYVIYRLYELRQELTAAHEQAKLDEIKQQLMEAEEGGAEESSSNTKKEGFGGRSSSTSKNPSSSSTSPTPPLMDKSLTNYVIKTSYNSCITKTLDGRYKASCEILENVLADSYRCIDLELIYAYDNSSFLSSSSTNQRDVFVSANYFYKDQSNSSSVNKLPLVDVIDTIINVGLTDASARSPPAATREPLFVNLRLKMTDDKNLMDPFYKRLYEILTKPESPHLNLSTFLCTDRTGGTAAVASASALSPKQIMDTKKPCCLIFDHSSISADAVDQFKKSQLNGLEFFSSGFNLGPDGADIRLLSLQDNVAADPSSGDGVFLDVNDGDQVRGATRLTMGIHTVSSVPPSTTSSLLFGSESTGQSYLANPNVNPVAMVKKYGMQFVAILDYSSNGDSGYLTNRGLFAPGSGFQFMSWVISYGQTRQAPQGQISKTMIILIVVGVVVFVAAVAAVRMANRNAG
jgi:hypothetical protein